MITKLIKGCKGTIYLAGNGGSAATASHFACDLIKKGYNVRNLASDVPLLTMLANDYGYEFIFSKQMNHAKKGDLLIVLSVSGKSPNIITALQVAKYREIDTIALTKKSGSKIDLYAEIVYHAQSDDYLEVENEHLAFLHDVAKGL